MIACRPQFSLLPQSPLYGQRFRHEQPRIRCLRPACSSCNNLTRWSCFFFSSDLLCTLPTEPSRLSLTRQDPSSICALENEEVAEVDLLNKTILLQLEDKFFHKLSKPSRLQRL